MEIVKDLQLREDPIEEQNSFFEAELVIQDSKPLEPAIDILDLNRLILLKLALNDLITPIIAILPAK